VAMEARQALVTPRCVTEPARSDRRDERLFGADMRPAGGTGEVDGPTVMKILKTRYILEHFDAIGPEGSMVVSLVGKNCPAVNLVMHGVLAGNQASLPRLQGVLWQEYRRSADEAKELERKILYCLSPCRPMALDVWRPEDGSMSS
jgi:hypothetical protein